MRQIYKHIKTCTSYSVTNFILKCVFTSWSFLLEVKIVEKMVRVSGSGAICCGFLVLF